MNVEELLTQNIWRIGGVHVRSLVGDSPGFDNADFLFQSDNVVAELKCLDEDLINDPQFIEKATAAHLDELKRDRTCKVPIIFGDHHVTTQGRSEQFIKTIRDLYYDPLKRSIKKANRQIKVTAERLGIEAPKGLVVIANNNHSALDPWHAKELFKDAFKRETFSGINSILYLSAGQGIEVIGEPRQMDVVMEYRSPHKTQLDRLFVKRFNQVWMEALAAARGSLTHGTTYEVGSNFLPAIRNRPRDR